MTITHIITRVSVLCGLQVLQNWFIDSGLSHPPLNIRPSVDLEAKNLFKGDQSLY